LRNSSDAITGHHIWAERYEQEFADIFALHDEITERIVAAIERRILSFIFAQGTARSYDSG